MNATIEDTLLDLFQQVTEDPDHIPTMPIDALQEDSQKQRLLASFRQMLECLQQSKQQAEEQLREKEEQYRSIFEASTDALIICDLEGTVVEVNPAACRLSGEDYNEWIGINISYPKPSDMQSHLNQASFQGRSQLLNVPGKILHKNGTFIPVETRSIPFNYKGQLHILTTVHDVTERLQAEQQLREREEQYRSVFEATTDGLIIVDMEESRAVEVNPRACQMFGYTYEEMLGRSVNITDEGRQPVVNARDVVKAGGFFQMRETATGKEGTTFDTEIHATPFTYKGRPHMLAIVRDITEQMAAEKQLREREEQYRSIFEATSDALAIIDLQGHYVEVNPAACQIFGYTREELIGQHVSARSVTKSATAQALDTLQAGRSYAHSHLTGAAPSWGVRKDGSVFPFDANGSPITYRGQSHSLIVGRDITEQVQAQQLLEQRVEERTSELASLLEISHTLASTLQLEPLVNVILDQLKTMVNCTGASILTLEGDRFVILDIPNPTPEEQLMQLRFSPQYLGSIWKVMTSREMVLLPDVRGESPMAQALREAMGELMDTRLGYVRACLFVPLTLKDRVVGMLVMTSREADAFTQHHAELALAIANQAAIAIDNARLYAQAQDLAALEERQKLARELHDSVSQALYGISLGAHAARTALERDPDGVAEPLDYVLSLAEAALAEMRALIFELRPESLETEGLVSALSKQAAATQARHELVVATELCDEPSLSQHVKQELYRVAQEAMHNIVKHAHASQVILRMEQNADMIVLEVHDNGAGFDTSASFPGHLGLHSMRERVTNLGGMFEIESAPGIGTRIGVRVPGGE